MRNLSQRVYWECDSCSWGVCGPEDDGPALLVMLDAHEEEKPGHTMKFIGVEET